MNTFEIVAGLLAMGLAVAAAVQLTRSAADRRLAQEARVELLRAAVPLPDRFGPALVADLPEPARRFFNFAIQPGARLSTVVEIRMGGELSLGSKQGPEYRPMRAEQVLAPPHGLVWQVKVGRGAMRLSGSDGMTANRSWTRFWLLRLVPVVRVGGDADHLRSSFARVVAEAAFWAPAFLLPRPGVSWTALDQDTARATVAHGGLQQEVEIRVDASGRPVWVSMPRWSNANPERVFRVQPFGGELSDFRDVSGYRLPFRVDGGNFFGTADYFPFYRARVTSIQFH
jgi:hypothetical protein